MGMNENNQSAFIDQIFWSDDFERMFSQLKPSDEQWLRRWAEEEKDVRAITLILVGMENSYSTRAEEYTDEDTGEPFTFIHAEKMEGETLFPGGKTASLRLYTLLCQQWQNTDRSVLYRVWNTLKCCTTLDYSVLLHHLADEADDSDAQSELAEAYRYGDERNGIYRNYDLARKYCEMTGDTFTPEGDDAPCEYDYTLTGNADTLAGVKRMIDDLCQQFGTPSNELGLFVPLQAVMRLLVGSSDYRGNIIRMEQPSAECLKLHVEANEGNPLLFALRQSFENLTVEVN